MGFYATTVENKTAAIFPRMSRNAYPRSNSATSGLRFYISSIGRWVNRDPIGERGGLGLYIWCANDGVLRWDFLGKDMGVGRGIGEELRRMREPDSRSYSYAANWAEIKESFIAKCPKDGPASFDIPGMSTQTCCPDDCIAISLHIAELVATLVDKVRKGVLATHGYIPESGSELNRLINEWQKENPDKIKDGDSGTAWAGDAFAGYRCVGWSMEISELINKAQQPYIQKDRSCFRHARVSSGQAREWFPNFHQWVVAVGPSDRLGAGSPPAIILDPWPDVGLHVILSEPYMGRSAERAEWAVGQERGWSDWVSAN